MVKQRRCRGFAGISPREMAQRKAESKKWVDQHIKQVNQRFAGLTTGATDRVLELLRAAPSQTLLLTVARILELVPDEDREEFVQGLIDGRRGDAFEPAVNYAKLVKLAKDSTDGIFDETSKRYAFQRVMDLLAIEVQEAFRLGR